MAAAKKQLTPSLFSSYYHFITHFIPNWEEIVDPNNPLHQMSLLAGIHEIAGALPDRALRSQLQSITKKAIAEVAQKI